MLHIFLQQLYISHDGVQGLAAVGDLIVAMTHPCNLALGKVASCDMYVLIQFDAVTCCMNSNQFEFM